MQLTQRGFGIADGVVFAGSDERIKCMSIFCSEFGIFFHLYRLADEAIQLLQPNFQRCDLPRRGFCASARLAAMFSRSAPILGN